MDQKVQLCRDNIIQDETKHNETLMKRVLNTPWKINMEPKNAGLEDNVLFQLGDVEVCCWFVVHFCSPTQLTINRSSSLFTNIYIYISHAIELQRHLTLIHNIFVFNHIYIYISNIT